MAEMMSQKEPADFADMPVGEILRRTREHYEQSLEDIERALRIRACQIEAIEQGRLDQLPGKVYAIGFVRSYSEFLGLDGDRMVHLFKVQAVGTNPASELQFPMPASDSKLPPLWLALLSLAVAIAVLAFYVGMRNQTRQVVEEIPPVPKAMQKAAEQTLQGPSSTEDLKQVLEQESATQEPTIEEKPPEGIILNIVENSWVEIRDQKGKAMLSRVLKAGDQYYVPDRPDLTISIGNASGVEIEVDGQKLQKLGEKGQVLRRLPLDARHLKKNFAVETAH